MLPMFLLYYGMLHVHGSCSSCSLCKKAPKATKLPLQYRRSRDEYGTSTDAIVVETVFLTGQIVCDHRDHITLVLRWEMDAASGGIESESGVQGKKL